MPDFYTIPFPFESFLRQKDEDLYCSQELSLRQSINLIITTRLGAFRFDPEFGCHIWDMDFVVPSNLNTWKEEIKQSLYEAIVRHESRIEEIRRFAVEVKKGNSGEIRRIHQRLDIELEGTVKGTHDAFAYSETLYFSPFSLI